MKTREVALVAAVAVLFILAGCHGIGPGTLDRDRSDYIAAISDSWKHQMLLNMVKLRYADAPVFLDVLSVISQYALEGDVSLAAGWANHPYSANQGIGIIGKYTDRPTITYGPLSGEKFARSFIRPLPPAAVMQLVQSGYRADIIWRLCVQSVNGISNRYGGAAQSREADPDFYRLVAKLAAIQKSGRLAIRMQEQGDKSVIVMVFDPKKDEALMAEVEEIYSLLGIAPGTKEIKVVYGSAAANNTEIAIQTRSMLQILVDMASQIEVPDKDIAERRVGPTFRSDPTLGAMAEPLVRIHCSARKPADASAAVPYRGQWFWIDDKDYPSKGMFSAVMLLFSLTETGGKGEAPIVTVSTN
jgi:hypothetical protein